MDPPPPKQIKIGKPKKSASEIFEIVPVAERLSQMLTANEAAAMREVDRRLYHAFQETFQSVVVRKYGLDIEKIRSFLAANEIDLWAAGSSVLHTYLQVLNSRTPSWASADLDLYINPRVTSAPLPPGWRGSLKSDYTVTKALWDNTPTEVVNAVNLILSMGYTETQHFKDDWNENIDTQFMDEKETLKARTKVQETIRNAQYSGGFMRKNKIRDIYTFVRNTDPSIQVQLVVVVDKGDNTRIDIKKVIDNFDLTCCSIGYNFRASRVYMSPDARDDISSARMKLRAAYMQKYAWGNYILHKRIAKYASRGFTLSNPVPLTMAISKLRLTIGRLKFRLMEIEEYDARREFLSILPAVSQIQGGRIRIRQSAANIRNSIMLLEERIQDIESGNLAALVHETPKETLRDRIGMYTRQYDRNLRNLEVYNRQLQGLTTDEDFEINAEGQRPGSLAKFMYANKLRELQRSVTPGARKDDEDRLKLHNFKLSLRLLRSARYKSLSENDCSNIDDTDFITLQSMRELTKPYEVYKRVVYKVRPNKVQGDESENEDVESPDDLPIFITCYKVDALHTDIKRQQGQNRTAKWPNDRQVISEFDLLRIKLQKNMFEFVENNIDLKERTENAEKGMKDIDEMGNKWQKVLIGGKVKMKRRSLSPKRKSPMRTRKPRSLRRKSRKSRRSRGYK